MLKDAGIPVEEVEHSETLYSELPRHHASTLLAVFTRQEELLPAVIGNGWESAVWESDIEKFVR